MNDDTKLKQFEKLIEMLPSYNDPAWNDNLDGCKLDVAFAKAKMLEILQPNPLHSLWKKEQ